MREVSDQTESQSGRSCGATHRPSAFRGFRCTHDADRQTTTRPQCYEHQGLDWARASRLLPDAGRPNWRTARHRELRSYRGSRLVKFFLGIFINFTDTYETGESFFFIFFFLIFFTYSK